MDVETVTELPDVVAAFVRAVNEGQHEALLKTFAEDALVNDPAHRASGRVCHLDVGLGRGHGATSRHAGSAGGHP